MISSVSNTYERNYMTFVTNIQSCLTTSDVPIFTPFFVDLFTVFDNDNIRNNEGSRKVNSFWTAFTNCSYINKYSNLNEVAKNNNKWIYQFLNCDGSETKKRLLGRWYVLYNLKNLLQQMGETICPFLEPSMCNLCLEGVITSNVRDDVIAALENRGPINGMMRLMELIDTQDPNWYSSFLWIVSQHNADFMHILAKELVEDGEPLTKELVTAYANVFINKHVQVYIDENSDDVVEEIQMDGVSNEDNDQGYPESIVDEVESLSDFQNDFLDADPSEILELREFQQELVLPALQDHNVIIYAPTGCGKTIVAAHIINEHLKKNSEGRALFLVHRKPLVTQQFKVLDRYRGGNVSIVAMEPKSGSLAAHLCGNNRIFVMTADILNNALTNDDGNMIRSLCEFSIIVFDECHNYMKGHPYVRIMRAYYDEMKQLQQSSRTSIGTSTLPQIVGLTASPRTDKKDDILGIQQSLYKLCATMDCRQIACVRQHRDQLQQFLSYADQEIERPNNRMEDNFERAVQLLMAECETKLKTLRSQNVFPPGALKLIPSNRFTENYVGFVGNLQQLNTKSKSENSGKERVYSIFKYLNAYHRGLVINQMFHQELALKTIKRHLDKEKEVFTCDYDEQFYRMYRDILGEGYEEHQLPNPALTHIVNIVKQQLHKREDSRILIFVKEVEFAHYLAKILQQHDVSAASLVGTSCSTHHETMKCSLSEMTTLLDQFKNGDLRVIVATTVLEEGLDVALCNMVISYGHVTNETAMIQRRGRARADNSRYILILPHMLAWMEKKERINEFRRNKMMQVVETLQVEDPVFLEFITNYQQENFFIKKRKIENANASSGQWKFVCKACQTTVCFDEEIRLLDNAHRVIIDPKKLSLFRVIHEPLERRGKDGTYANAGKIFCYKCENQRIGNHVLYKELPFFQLKIDMCNVVNTNTGESRCLKSWKEFVPLHKAPSIDIHTELPEYQKKLNLS